MSPGRILLALFLLLLSLQFSLSMELPLLAWIGAGLTLVCFSRLVTVERPTWGLLFVLFATGGFIGNQIIEDWALDGSWPQDNGLGAGILLSMLAYLLWLFAAQDDRDSEHAIDRDTQTILVWGLLLILLQSPPEGTIVMLLGVPAPLITLAAILLACLVLLADRCAGMLWSRLLLLLPLALIVPLMQLGLGASQGPVVGALGDLFPRSNDFTPTGFSPYQTLRASVFLRPSNRAVMRIETTTPDLPPYPYLAGNRLVNLNEELVWLPSERALRSYGPVDAETQDNGELRYTVDNYHYRGSRAPQSVTVHSLANDDYLFVSPGTSHITGRFGAISRNAADVLTPAFERGSDRRWRMESGGSPRPDVPDEEYLQLPRLWDQSLQAKSEEFGGATRQQTVDNVVNHFTNRRYALQVDFDPQRPFHDFFLNDDPAYCFWFATGATLALRANGIPSRLVGGYVVHEQLNARLWLVRERDAHSWVEWQDGDGYWHTIDPTPPSIEAFFGGYRSSRLSLWYHALAGQWQILIDRILEQELMANLIRYGGIAILIFLFAREYRRIRGQRGRLDNRREQWEKLWQRFLSLTRLPANSAWTASNYADALPAEWPAAGRDAVRSFLRSYSAKRFADQDDVAIRELESELEQCSRTLMQQGQS